MEKDLCVKGWNWGTVKFGGESGERLRFGEKVGWRVSAFNLFCSLSVTASDFLSVCNSSTFSLRASSVLGTVPGLEVTVQAKCPVLRDLQSGGNMLYADSSFWRSFRCPQGEPLQWVRSQTGLLRSDWRVREKRGGKRGSSNHGVRNRAEGNAISTLAPFPLSN